MYGDYWLLLPQDFDSEFRLLRLAIFQTDKQWTSSLFVAKNPVFLIERLRVSHEHYVMIYHSDYNIIVISRLYK